MDIYLRATKVQTGDNIEYLVPNSNIISNTILDYTLTSALVRIELPVGVSYIADPRQVEKILLAAAENEMQKGVCGLRTAFQVFFSRHQPLLKTLKSFKQ